MAENGETMFQGVAVISCSEMHPNQLIERIIGPPFSQGNFTRQNFGHNWLDCYPWHLATKYYEADIGFIMIPSHNSVVGSNFESKIQAVIIHLDPNNASGLNSLHLWTPFLDHCDPEIRLLVVGTAKEDSALSRHTLLTWCIEHGFELIELEAEECSDDEEMENDFKESNGVERIFQALSAHQWPVMDMKEASGYQPSDGFKHLQKQAEASAAKIISDSQDSEDVETSMQRLRIDSLFDEDKDIFDSLMHSAEPNFENLFEKFQDLKKKAEKLTGEERKLYAEKVTLSFWKALGGGEDEIEGLDL